MTSGSITNSFFLWVNYRKNEKIRVEVPDLGLTCGWLLSEVISRFDGDKDIVMLGSSNCNEMLDYWLNFSDR